VGFEATKSLSGHIRLGYTLGNSSSALTTASRWEKTLEYWKFLGVPRSKKMKRDRQSP